MHRAPQEGQNPRRLHDSATSFSPAQSAQRRRRNLWANRLRSAKARDAALEKGVEIEVDGNPPENKDLLSTVFGTVALLAIVTIFQGGSVR